jgi:hypothetical protein
MVAIATWAFVGTVGFIFTASWVNAPDCLQGGWFVGKTNFVITHLAVSFARRK